MTKNLAVGRNGFLGSHLVDWLVAAGHQVTAFDRFSKGVQNFQSANVTAIPGDFLDRSHLAQAVSGHDYVFHFLSATTPATAGSDPTLDVRTNLAQSVELLETCAAAGVRRVFFASTGGAIYGPQSKERFSEDDPTLPISPYGIVKLAIENYLRYFQITRSLDYTVFRISNPYGPRQHNNKVQGLIPVVLNRIAQHRSVTRLGDGSMVRDYIYVDDLMTMIGRVIAAENPRDLYNLGRGEGHSVNEILESVHRVTERDIELVEKAAPKTFVPRPVLDISRFTEEFGSMDYTPFDEGIRATWQSIEITNADAPVQELSPVR